MDANLLITKYRGRDRVEISIKEFRGLLDLERVLFTRDERIECFIFLKVIACLALSFLRFEAAKEGIKTTTKEIKENLSNVTISAMTVVPLELVIFGVQNHDTDLNVLFREKLSLPHPKQFIQILNKIEETKIEHYVIKWYKGWLKKNTL